MAFVGELILVYALHQQFQICHDIVFIYKKNHDRFEKK